MGINNWAEEEIKIACKRENPDWDGKSFDYGCSCYQSALKAYKSLMEDGHSSFSFSMTRSILKRLLDELPLTPIEGKDDEWCQTGCKLESGVVSYQSSRMYSLFKDVYPDGKILYHDTNRAYCQELTNPKDTFYSGYICRLIDKIFPITMPYNPSGKRFKIVVKTFLAKGYEADDEDWNTRATLWVETPEGEKFDLNYFFADKGKNVVEITHTEYEERLAKEVIKEEKPTTSEIL